MSRFLGTKGHRAVSYGLHSPIIRKFGEFRGGVPRQTLFWGATDAAAKGLVRIQTIPPVPAAR